MRRCGISSGTLAELGHLDEAALCLRQALTLQPDYAEAYYNLGNVLVNQKKPQEAVAQFHRALELRPAYGEVYNNLGLALIELRRSAEAVVILQQGVRLRPVAESHNNLGLALADLGRFEEAEACHREALRLNPAFVDAHGNLANLYKEQGRLDEALAGYQGPSRAFPPKKSPGRNIPAKRRAPSAGTVSSRGWCPCPTASCASGSRDCGTKNKVRSKCQPTRRFEPTALWRRGCWTFSCTASRPDTIDKCCLRWPRPSASASRASAEKRSKRVNRFCKH